MKKVIVSILFILIISGIHAQENKSFEGIISYTITFDNINNDTAMLYKNFGRKMQIFYKDSLSKMKIVPGDTRESIIIDAGREAMVLLTQESNTKNAIVFSELSLLKQNPIEIEYNEDTKNIAGKKCKKAIVSNQGQSFEVYYTDEIHIPGIKFQPEKYYNGFPFLMMEFSIEFPSENNKKSITVKYIAESIERKDLSQDIFSIPSDYDIKSIQQYIKEKNQQEEKNQQTDTSNLPQKRYEEIKYDTNELALFNAASSGNIKKVKLLIEGGTNVNAQLENRATPLIAASLNNHQKIIKYLIENGADIDIISSFHTALSAAVCNGHISLVKYFVSKGADVNRRSIFNTPLMEAAEKSRFELVDFLLKKGADINKESPFKTVLMKTVEVGNYAMVEYLLEKEADINKATPYGTPLIEAVKNNRLEIVKLLLQHNADVTIMDHENRNAYDYARALEFYDIVEVLENTIK